MKKGKKAKKVKNQNFVIGMVRNIAITLAVLAILFVFIYFLFISDSCLIAGHNLEKSDWLGFLGGYISLTATVCLGVITVYQTVHYENKESERREKEREKEIKPIFSIEILNGSDDMESVRVEIENVGKYPIRKVWVNNQPFCQLLRVGEKRIITLTYAINEEIKKDKIRLTRSEDTPNEEAGYPQNLLIHYENADGIDQQQEFELEVIEVNEKVTIAQYQFKRISP